jgi:folate-dependent phosphoribosylglycinamide formyltransferase PurN
MTTPRPKALVLTSTSQRHRYFALEMAKIFDVVGVMAEAKQNYFTEARRAPSVEKHFEQLAIVEKEFFPLPSVNSIEIRNFPNLNAPESVAYAKSLAPDVICLFGTSILKKPWLEAFPDRIVNLHLGLSPFYRGSATLFWPFYFRELECLGATIHLAIQKVDAGAILKRVKATLLPGDSYYAATTRLIRDSIHAFPITAKHYLEGSSKPFPQENVAGRVLKKSDFNESKLLTVLDYVGGGLTQEQISRAVGSSTCRCSQ